MGQCDKCGRRKVHTRRLELGGGTGMVLCDRCLREEIKWRKQKNKMLIRHYGSKKNAGSTLFRTTYVFRKKKRIHIK